MCVTQNPHQWEWCLLDGGLVRMRMHGVYACTGYVCMRWSCMHALVLQHPSEDVKTSTYACQHMHLQNPGDGSGAIHVAVHA
jgi:hypothetical protein